MENHEYTYIIPSLDGVLELPNVASRDVCSSDNLNEFYCEEPYKCCGSKTCWYVNLFADIYLFVNFILNKIF